MDKEKKLFFTLMTKRELKNIKKNYRRNDLCPCGSGKKFKKCHWLDYQEEVKKRFNTFSMI